MPEGTFAHKEHHRENGTTGFSIKDLVHVVFFLLVVSSGLHDGSLGFPFHLLSVLQLHCKLLLWEEICVKLHAYRNNVHAKSTWPGYC